MLPDPRRNRPLRVGFLREPFSGERLQAEPFLAIRAHGQRHSLGRLGRRGGDAHGGADEAAGLGRRRATRFCDWIGRVAMGSESQRTVMDATARDPRGVPHEKPYDLTPGPPVASRSTGAAPKPERARCWRGRASHLRDGGAKDAVRDAMMSLTTYGRCVRSRALSNRRDLTHPTSPLSG